MIFFNISATLTAPWTLGKFLLQTTKQVFDTLDSAAQWVR